MLPTVEGVSGWFRSTAAPQPKRQAESCLTIVADTAEHALLFYLHLDLWLARRGR